MKYLLLCILFLTSFSAISAECFVVSGAKADDVGIFANRKILNPQTSVVNGKKCKVVDGLAALKAAVIKANIKPNSDLLVVFGAHGVNMNGVIKYQFNSDAPTTTQVYDYLRTLSKKYQVGAVLHACESGNVMHKLIQEENDPLAGKLCLVTSSSKGRMSFPSPNDLLNSLENVGRPNAPKTLEDIYLQTSAGLISSAAWEEAGIAKYYRTKNLTEAVAVGFEALKDMDQIVRALGQCETAAEINSALCVAPGVSDTILKDLMHLSDPYISKTDKLLIHNTYPHWALTEVGDGKICLQGLADFYKANDGGIVTWGGLERALIRLKKNTKLIAACEAFKKQNKHPEVKNIYTGDLEEGLSEYQASLARLKRIYSKTDWTNFDLKEFAKKAAGDKAVCSPQNKALTIQSIFGDKFFSEEIYTDNNGYTAPAETAYGRTIHTQHLMKAFQNASIDKTDMPNAIDAKRRKACRDFKF